MSDQQAERPPDLDRPAAFGAFSLLSALLSVVMVIAMLQPAPQDPAQQIAYVAAHRPMVALEAVAALMWAVLSVPFVVALGQLLRCRSAAVAATATILSSAGMLLLGYSVRTSIGAMLAVMAASPASRTADAVYQVAIWRNLSFFLSDPGLMTWGFGQFLFGWLARKSRVLPDWLAWVGMLGGLAGLLTDAVYQTGLLAVVQMASFAIWGLVTGLALLRASQAKRTGGAARL